MSIENNTIWLDGKTLTFDEVLAVADGEPGSPRVELSATATADVIRSARAVQKLLDEGIVAYGITTGFGAFKDRLIAPAEVEQLQHNILVSHAVGVGDLLDIPTTRATMLIRANTLARGYSGIRLQTLQLLIDMLNEGVHPCIPAKGSLGASGDLAPLAHMSLPLIGLGEADYGGERLPGSQALQKAGMKPLKLAAKEGLALTNGTAVMCALGVLETVRAERLSQTADIAGCLSLEALQGTDLAFDERIQDLRAFPRQQECARYLRRLLHGSQLIRDHASSDVQDAYTLRCMPQVHGAVRDAIAYARWVFELELNAVTDNPLLFIDESTGAVEVISGGNFHGEPLSIAMDYLGLAVAELGNISERRIMRLTDENSNTHVLPAFLTEKGGLNSGFMIVQYTAAALATENKILAHPASVDTIPTSANVEDHVSMGCTAGLKLRQIQDNVENILAIELISAAQGIDCRIRKLPQATKMGDGTGAAYELIRRHIPFLPEDAVMSAFLAAARKMVADGEIVRQVNDALPA
jgi:histidine ammonia-lyase